MTRTSSDQEESCPICLRDDGDVDLVRTPCKHISCLSCMERILATPVTTHRENIYEDSDIPDDSDDLDVPTRGRCPMCRHPIDLFQLEKVHDGPKVLVISKHHDIASTDLAGRVYVKNRSAIGNHSIHFPALDGGSDPRPYVDISKGDHSDRELQQHLAESNGKLFFEQGCHFHEPTRTFEGRIRLGSNCADRFMGSLFWEYSLTFSDDYQYICRGVIVKRRDTCHNPICSETICKFKLDGRWRVSWPDIPGSTDRVFHVHSSNIIEFSDTGQGENKRVGVLNDEVLYFFNRRHQAQNPNQESPSYNISLKNKSWWKSNTAIDLGGTIEIDAPPERANQRMLWTLTAKRSRHLAVTKVGTGTAILYSSGSTHGETASYEMPTFVAESVWGNTFCQGLTVGLASYHFMETIQEGAYISYEHENALAWPPLDNGNPIPRKIWFTEISFDAVSRIFRGKIDWYGTHGTTWQGCRWWR